MQLLIAEDDKNLASALCQILEENGYETDAVHRGDEALDWASAAPYDAIVLDVMLPAMDGFEVSRELRRRGISTPVLLLTARDSISDKICGLDSGADDYMTKPFSPAELMAHLRALTRRRGDVVFERLSLGDLTLDLDSHELSCRDKGIGLSAKEFDMMRLLMENRGRTLSKDQLLDKVWGPAGSSSDNNVEAYISFLRKKLTHLGSDCVLETIRKAGYRLVEGGSQ